MQKEPDIQDKDRLLQRKFKGGKGASIIADTGIPRSTVYSWIVAAREAKSFDSVYHIMLHSSLKRNIQSPGAPQKFMEPFCIGKNGPQTAAGNSFGAGQDKPDQIGWFFSTHL